MQVIIYNILQEINTWIYYQMKVNQFARGGTVVASSPVVYTEEDTAVAIVDVKPSMGSVSSSTRTKVSCPVNVSYQVKVIQLVRGRV